MSNEKVAKTFKVGLPIHCHKFSIIATSQAYW